MSNLASPAVVRGLAETIGIRPSRRLGQNFLIDGNILRILVDAASLSPADRVLEVGPGLGVVTVELLKLAGGVVAVEKDRRLCEHLRASLAGHPGLDLVEGDALDIDLGALLRSGITAVVSNLPYSAGSRILGEIFASDSPPARIVVTVQKEVGDRLLALPGTHDYGMLSVWAQLPYSGRRVKAVGPSCFWPRPEVGSTIVKLELRSGPLGPPADLAACRDLARLAFTQRRKQLGVILRRAAGAGTEDRAIASALAAAGLEARARPEDVTPGQWLALARRISLPRV